jgi:hypothetical protein
VSHQGANGPSGESASLGSSYMRAARLASSTPLEQSETGKGHMETGGKWIEEAAKGLWKEDDVDVEWDAETRSKLLSIPYQPQPASANHSNGSHLSSVDASSTAGTRTQEDAPGVEGPEVLESGEGTQDVGIPLHLMPGNGTGDEFLDRALQEEGVRFTGDDRPFGMPNIPVKSPDYFAAAGSARKTEKPDESGVPVHRKDSTAAEDASKFEKVYEVR